jgi:acetoin utilization deacetylase AcuC-like enzyme
MKIITDDTCTGYSRPGHPEKPARVERTLEKLRAQSELPIIWAKPGATDDTAILRAHTPELLASLGRTEDFDADSPAYPGIANYARASVGAALEAMRSARKGETVLSLMRPPGHHAMRNRIMGFCYLNNIAIAALDALATGVKRVAIFDFDVHHGNGTEDILLNREGAAFYSIHQFPAYPETGRANVGKNCFNYPVPAALPRGEYRDVFSSALEQLKQFRPELIGVSAGFDAYARDPLAQETLEAEDFYWLGQKIRALNVPTYSVLEGGYSRDLPNLVFSYLKGLEGK